METFPSFSLNEVLSLFKSYYVVWKPSEAPTCAFMGTPFKSYYVVWKPQVGCEDKMSSRRFKSYYVVWKLTITSNNRYTFGCLNRTM